MFGRARRDGYPPLPRSPEALILSHKRLQDPHHQKIIVTCAQTCLLLCSMLMFNVYTNVNNLKSYIIVKIAYFYIYYLMANFSQYS